MKLARVFDTLLLRRRRLQATRRRILRHFADQLGMVYFGFVDQHHDDHKVVRGFTLSSTHHDESYIVGQYEGYSVGIVDRFDALSIGKKIEKHAWLVIELELSKGLSLPHMFLLPTHQKNVHYNKIFTAFRSLERVSLPGDVPDFHSRYEVFSAPDQHVAVDELLKADVLRVIAAHFWPIAIEVNSSHLYCYYADAKLSEQLLHALIKNSAWLAEALEKSAESD